MSKRRIRTYTFLGVALVCVVLLSLSVGSASLTISDIFRSIIGEGGAKQDIFRFVRLPRVFAGFLVGGALGGGGLILQTVLNNPIAGPNVLGINAGAGFFALLGMVLFPGALWLTPALAFSGALLASLLVYTIGKKIGASKITLVLSGVAINALFGAMSDTVITLSPAAQLSRSAFTVGGLSGINSQLVWVNAVVIALGIAGGLALSHKLEILSLGDDTARSLGLNVGRTRRAALVLSGLLIGAAVSLGGLISFVGLISPHIARRFFKVNTAELLAGSVAIGGILVLVCDTLARTVFSPFELPVGIVLSFLGAPFFLWLLVHKGRGAAL